MRTLVILFLAGVCCCAGALAAQREEQADVVVYAGTPAGIAGALSAAKAGRGVLLIEPMRHIGGLVTNGLTHTDLRSFEGMTGTFLDFARRVEAHYAKAHGADSEQARLSRHGTQSEPSVNLKVFERMIAEQPRIRVVTGWRLTKPEMSAGGKRVVTAQFANAAGDAMTVRAQVFIDASYEGDLMAAAGVPWRVGREGKAEHGESLAPEQPDGQVQGYNFRLTMTRAPANRVPLQAPAGYRADEFLPLLPLLESGQIKSVFCSWSGGIYKAQDPVLPNGKFDINDVSHAPVRLSLPQLSPGWPDGSPAERKRIFDAHVRHNVGMLYFLQNDPRVPEKFREEARQMGWCRDEYADNGHMPEQLYVREARRMVGQHVFTEQDTGPAEGSARARFRGDGIAMCDYGLNCHGTAHEGPQVGGKHTGEFYKSVPPYQAPIGMILPRECENLIVPVAVSSSHVGFCAWRFEPAWTSLGQAAGYVAHLAIERKVAVQSVAADQVQRLLHRDGAATMYVSDVPAGHPDFVAVQWWASRGGLHAIPTPGIKPGQRGKQIAGQYYEAYPGHAVELDAKLDDELRLKWLGLTVTLPRPAEQFKSASTRGEFIRAAFSAFEARSRE